MTLPNESTVCQRCRSTVVPVAVAGHTQCPDCNQVIDECCSGESISLRAETEPEVRVGVDCGREPPVVTYGGFPVYTDPGMEAGVIEVRGAPR